MDLVLCHTTADFDTLGAAVGLTRLQPGSRIVLAGGAHPTVQRFLALHRDEYSLIERRAVNFEQVRSLTVVDTAYKDRLGVVADWIDRAATEGMPISLFDHHYGSQGDIPAQQRTVATVGAVTTLVVEQLQEAEIKPTIAEATVMALGIHVDTGSLTYEQATARDAQALAWLMERGVSQQAIAEFVEPGLSPQLQELFAQAMADLESETRQGYLLSRVDLPVTDYVPGLSSLAERLMSWSDSDVLLLGAYYPHSETVSKLTLIGRMRGRLAKNRANGLDLSQLLGEVGGGGHPTAAAATLTTPEPEAVINRVWQQVRSHLPHPPNARELMSSPVRTIRPATTITEAQRILLRYGHSGLSVVDDQDELVGMISRRDIDLALHHGFGHAPVKGYMTTDVKTITPETSLPQIESLMVTYDIGRLPVVAQNQLLGIVTRTDVLRQLHQDQYIDREEAKAALPAAVSTPAPAELRHRLQQSLGTDLWKVLTAMASAAQSRGCHLYIVGGAVRDLLLNGSAADSSRDTPLTDIDLVVDGFYQTAESGAGVALAEVIKQQHPEVELQSYGRFQTAALVWHSDINSPLAGLMIDIATARTEFYPYPAANPEVEASSIRQDLYRRDFTINAMAIRLTTPGSGTLLDYFGGLLDLRQHHVRVLHANSFIEDPTRIYRAVRFAVRLGFTIDAQTEGYIHHALESGIYSQMQRQVARVPALQTRLRNELKYILEAPYWQPALSLIDRLGALRCLHSELSVSERLWHQLRRMSRWLERFQSQIALPPWLMRLEVLLSELPATARQPVAEALQLPQDSQERLATLADQETHLAAQLPQCEHPSDIDRLLRPLDLGTLLLVSARHPRPCGQVIWRYLTQWRQMEAPLNGHDLKQLGYRPGPHYRVMLDALRAATLDGQIEDAATAEKFLLAHFHPSNGTQNSVKEQRKPLPQADGKG